VTLTAPVTSAMKFYRVSISDVDTDGDGVNDWEEYQLGLDPTNPFSNGQQDSNGNAIGDYAYVTNMLASQNVITIAATVVTATQADPGENATITGQFTVTRGGFPLDSITVNLGPGAPGIALGWEAVDYGALPTSVTLGVGVSSQTITLTPMADTKFGDAGAGSITSVTRLKLYHRHPSNASVVIYPSRPPAAAVWSASITPIQARLTRIAKNFNPTNLFLTRIDPIIDFTWSNGMSPKFWSNGYYTVRWTGQVQPQFSETYTFDVRSDDGCQLWSTTNYSFPNGRRKVRRAGPTPFHCRRERATTFRLDYLQDGGSAQADLSWYSPSQSEEVIPNTCLYPSNSVR